MNAPIDMFTVAKIRSLSKQRRREKREKTEGKFTTVPFATQKRQLEAMDVQLARKRQADTLIQTIKALEVLGVDTSERRAELRNLLSLKCQQ